MYRCSFIDIIFEETEQWTSTIIQLRQLLSLSPLSHYTKNTPGQKIEEKYTTFYFFKKNWLYKDKL